MLKTSRANLGGGSLRTTLVSNISLSLSILILPAAIIPVASAANLTVAAASDLAPAQRELASSFQELTGNTLRFVTGASGMLARQVENGAPYDVFLSANKSFVEDLARRGDIDPASVAAYALGRLGLWIPGKANARIEDLADLKRIAIANPKHAPYGVAAEQALKQASIWDRLRDRLVLGENVRQALQFAESGNVDAVVASWSLVRSKGGTLIPDSLHDPIEQAAGILRTSAHQDAARQFLDFLRAGEGRRVLERHGLEPAHGRQK